MAELLVERGASLEAEYIVRTRISAESAPPMGGRVPTRLCVRAQNGLTPLHWAAFNGDVHVAQMLITRGAAIDARTKARCRRDGAEMAPRSW